MKTNLPETEGYTFFYSTRSVFSNWHPVRYTMNDSITFTTSEQGMMWEKAMLFGDSVIAARMLCVSDPKFIKKLGRQVRGYNDEIWARERSGLVYRHLYAKFIQNREMYDQLMGTGQTLLVEASPWDLIWGIGLDEKTAAITPQDRWPGQNLLGKLLTILRENLRSSPPQELH